MAEVPEQKVRCFPNENKPVEHVSVVYFCFPRESSQWDVCNGCKPAHEQGRRSVRQEILHSFWNYCTDCTRPVTKSVAAALRSEQSTKRSSRSSKRVWRRLRSPCGCSATDERRRSANRGFTMAALVAHALRRPWSRPSKDNAKCVVETTSPAKLVRHVCASENVSDTQPTTGLDRTRPVMIVQTI